MSLIVYGSYVNDLSEKILVWGKWVILDPECHILSHKSGSAVRIVFQFYTMKGVKRDRNNINGFFWKKSYCIQEQFGYFGTKMLWCPLHFESTLRFFINFTQ